MYCLIVFCPASAFAMLAERGNVRIRHAIIGSSDFDTCGEILARLETKLMVKMIYPLCIENIYLCTMCIHFVRQARNKVAVKLVCNAFLCDKAHFCTSHGKLLRFMRIL